jgi:hypothetical protein
LPPDAFYQIMTLHGAGMVGTAGLAGAAVMWYFLRRYVELSTGMFLAMLALSLIGVVMIIGAIAVGRFAGAWIFLHPLPAKSTGLWDTHVAAAFVGGLVFIGVGFLLFYIDCALALIRRYGSLARALGLDQLFGATLDDSLPPAVVASTMVILANVLGILAGAVVSVMSLVNLYVPGVAFDALLMKNLIFLFPFRLHRPGLRTQRRQHDAAAGGAGRRAPRDGELVRIRPQPVVGEPRQRHRRQRVRRLRLLVHHRRRRARPPRGHYGSPASVREALRALACVSSMPDGAASVALP